MRFVMILFTVSMLALPFSAEAASVAEQIKGRIVLDVHRHGEAWYIDPVTSMRVFLGRPADAFAAMRNYGLGITNADLARIPVAGTTGATTLARQLAGRIVLAVESKGEAWYIDPVSHTRVSLGRPDDAWNIMRSYGLGITSENLVSIPMAGDVDVRHDVPFFAQAPLGDWSDRRQAEGCEEASVLMAIAYARGETLSLSEARDAIIEMSDWELEEFGYFVDTSAQDTHHIIDDYLDYDDAHLVEGITVDDIREALGDDALVIVPAAGTVLANPHYRNGGPLRHTVVVVGYNATTDMFLVHDPGTQHGANVEVTAAHLQAALMNYASGDHAPVGSLSDAMIVVEIK